MKVSFDLVSDDKDYNLNWISINYWVETYIDDELNDTNKNTILLNENTKILSRENTKINFSVPIIYPNFNWFFLGIKNYVEINVDKKLNPFDLNEKKYFKVKINKLQDIESKELNQESKNLDDWLKNIDDEIKNLIIINDKINYDKIMVKIDENKKKFDKWNLTYNEFSDKNDKLNEELKDYFTISDNKKYDLLNKQKVSNIKNYIKDFWWESIWWDKKIKNDDRFININKTITDNVSIEFNEYLKNNYLIFRIRNFLMWNIFKKIIYLYFILLFILCILVINYNQNLVWACFTLAAITSLIIYLIIRWFNNYTYNSINNKIIKIDFLDKITIRNYFDQNNFNVKNIFNDLSINYSWQYTCNFNVKLDCILKSFRYEWSWKSRTRVDYEDIIYSFNIWQYIWKDFSKNNLIQIDLPKNFKDIKLPIWNLSKRMYARIVYQISYILKSDEIINKSWKITLN